MQSWSFPNVGQRSRSRSRNQNLWYHWKGLVIRYTHAKYESPISKGKKVISKQKIWHTKFSKCRSRSRSRSSAQNLWCHRKGLVIRNTRAKYESPIPQGKKNISKLSVTNGQTDGWVDWQTDGRRTKWSLSGALLCWRHKNTLKIRTLSQTSILYLIHYASVHLIVGLHLYT